MKNMTKILTVLLLVFGIAFAWSAPAEGSVAPNKKLYDFNFVNMDYEAVFRSVSVIAGVDILLAPDVKGKMTLRVTKKTWQETMDIICSMNDLTWVIQDKYITIQRQATYQAKQKKIADEEAQAENNAPLVRKNFQVHHAKADELVKVLESMKSGRGKITTVERTNSIIVYDTDSKIEQMEKALQELDVETLQIMITAKLVVVNSERARELGVDWSASMGTSTLTPGTAGGGVGGAGASRTSAAIQSYPHGGATPAVSGATSAISASLLDNNLQIAISNLMGDASTEVLASPQVSTLDNTEAKVFMGDKVSIRVIDDSGESSTQMVETGIKLTVTPHVSGDNRILLDLHPENNSYDYDSKGEIVISTQEAQTKVVVADGETVVIGGLTRNETQESESGIPFLKDIPLLGNLFKYTRKSVVKKDLVIFVTPRIIRNYIGNVDISEPTREQSSNSAPEAKKVEPEAVPVQSAPAEEPAAQPAEPAYEEPVAEEPAYSAPAEEAPAAPPVPETESSEDDEW
ncbi:MULTISPECIES: type IV pilus secretin PilQ [unclassified Fibrobacter]|uniref:type IV pilus secretin PilQ n=1 Tax=unclassified Fibrobacter TaxID=2634177 RepID=UPI000D6D3EF2|nr:MULTISPECIES: type IV pilus secretin PilQ [unclassified Fibrobacter]PWJ68263.1 type IV pilus assembly protein PilQ [Fibrobacter sp. UWR4]PZW72621.1 type IV pilus assembly protein PilQ [Fibrobacter sp. UWR1]